MIEYKLTRHRDRLTHIRKNFKSVLIHNDKPNEAFDFPPQIGHSIVVYSNIWDYWQTTEVKSVEKINDNKYSFTTLNSIYTVERIQPDIKLYEDKIKSIKNKSN